MKFGQITEYSVRNIFPEKYAENEAEFFLFFQTYFWFFKLNLKN